jgi:osmoprotectant transport system permease protein
MMPERRHPATAMLAVGLIAAVLALPGAARPVLAALGVAGREPVPVGRLLDLALSHGLIVALALVPAALVGIGLGIAVTRPHGRPLRSLADALVAASQAVPPVVVVALAFPVLGFGVAPTALALAIYCVMPVLRGTVAALEAAGTDVAEAARAMGMTPAQILREVEIPLAWPVVAQALRVALVLAIATAAVGALAGASTLGTPIIIGLQNQNEVAIFQGASATAALAFLADALVIAATRRRPPPEQAGPLANPVPAQDYGVPSPAERK